MLLHSTGLSFAYFGLSQGSSKSSGHASFMPTTLPLLQVLVVAVVSSGHASVMSTTLPSSQVLVVAAPPPSGTFVSEGSTVEVPVPSPPVIVVMSSGHVSLMPTTLPSSQVLVVAAPPVNVTFVASSSSSSSSPVTFAPTTVPAAFIAPLAPSTPALTTSVGMPVLADITAPTTDSMSLASTPPSAARITASSTALPVVIMPTLVPPPTVPTVPPKIGEVAPGSAPPVSPISNTLVTFPVTISASMLSGVSISGNLPMVAL